MERKNEEYYPKGKHFDKNNSLCPCPVEGCKFGGFSNIFSKYDEKLKNNIFELVWVMMKSVGLLCFKLDYLDFGEDKYRF